MTANKYFISADIEGITGVATREFSSSKGKCYDLAKRYMTSDLNAVISGILKADQNAEIIVKDAHGGATNLDLFSLNQRAELIQGWGNVMNMLFPLPSNTKCVFLVGYHAGGHNNEAALAHTFTRIIHYVKVNGHIINEAGLAGIYAGHFDVPLAFISGDDHAVSETKDLFHDICGVCVKKSHGRDCTISLPISETARILEENAETATRRAIAGEFKPLLLTKPLKCEVSLYNIGAKKSVFKHLERLLSFDNRFIFESENYLLKFEATSQKNVLEIFDLLIILISGISSLES